jgi:hypothetical protein
MKIIMKQLVPKKTFRFRVYVDSYLQVSLHLCLCASSFIFSSSFSHFSLASLLFPFSLQGIRLQILRTFYLTTFILFSIQSLSHSTSFLDTPEGFLFIIVAQSFSIPTQSFIQLLHPCIPTCNSQQKSSNLWF